MSKKTYAFLVVLIVLGGIIYVSKLRDRIAPVVKDIITLEPDKPATRFETFTLNFAGDVLPARAIERTMREKGYEYPFLKIKEELGDADITFLNLESPIIGTKENGRTTPGGTTVFRGDIDFAQTLKDVGVDIVSLANNHMKDQGHKGIVSTLETLDAIGLAHTGAGLDLARARRMTVMTIQKSEDTPPLRVGFLAYNDADVVPESYHATDKQSGTNIMEVSKVVADVKTNRAGADLLIVSMHSGTEYAQTANTRQKEFAHAAIDAGADIVIGHHPHELQPIEVYKGKYIFYSLGNFVFDQPWPETKQSVLVRMNVHGRQENGQWTDLSYTPFILPLAIEQFQPTPLRDKTSDQYKKTLARFQFPYSLLTLRGDVGEAKTLLVRQATTSESRQLGLSGTRMLPKGQGLWFVFDGKDKPGIWMKDMHFPIDIFWFNSKISLTNKELSVATSTYPNVFYSTQNAQYVLETGVGELGALSLTENLTGELTEIDYYDKK